MFDYEPEPHPDSYKSFVVVYVNDNGEVSLRTYTFAEIKENLAYDFWGNAPIYTDIAAGDNGNIAHPTRKGLWIIDGDSCVNPKTRGWE